MSQSKRKPSDAPEPDVPKVVINRLSLYLRELQHLLQDGHETISSRHLGRLLGFSDTQVRKDLAYFGPFGYPGIGYRCEELVRAIRKILGTDRQWNVGLVGCGNLGHALLGYKGFSQQGFQIVAAFDTNEKMIDSQVQGVQVYSMQRLVELTLAKNIKLAILAVPAAAAQTVADQVVTAGVEGIVNFAPVTIKLPERVSLVGVDLAIELEQLSFAALKRSREP